MVENRVRFAQDKHLKQKTEFLISIFMSIKIKFFENNQLTPVEAISFLTTSFPLVRIPLKNHSDFFKSRHRIYKVQTDSLSCDRVDNNYSYFKIFVPLIKNTYRRKFPWENWPHTLHTRTPSQASQSILQNVPKLYDKTVGSELDAPVFHLSAHL